MGLGGEEKTGNFGPENAAPKRVVIVDDSATLRAWLRFILEKDKRLQVVGEACDAFVARDVIREMQPDVITLDIEMPRMNGLEFLSRLMKLRPMPVVMLSAATRQGSEAAIAALTSGAVDCIVKPGGQGESLLTQDIARRVYHAACSQTQPQPFAAQSRPRPARYAPGARSPIILLGASTGGVRALDIVLSGLNPSGPPVVIVQHMPDQFLRSLSERLNSKLPQRVWLAEDGAPLTPGDVVFAPAAGQHTRIDRINGGWVCQLNDLPANGLHCPSVDALFASAAFAKGDVIAALMTGLGRDGAEGLGALFHAGATTFTQDAASCVVYGMPRIAQESGYATRQVDLGEMGAAINDWVGAHRLRPGHMAG